MKTTKSPQPLTHYKAKTQLNKALKFIKQHGLLEEWKALQKRKPRADSEQLKKGIIL